MLSRSISGSMFACALIPLLIAGCVRGPMTFHANTRVPDAAVRSVNLRTPTVKSEERRAENGETISLSQEFAR